MDPVLSIIVPIYNVAPWLRRCLESIKNQTLKEIEVILIDDGSTDGSDLIAEEYCADPRFKCFHTKNGGLSMARNRGLDEVKTDWIMFADGDDWVEPDFCKIPYDAAKNNNADLVIFRAYEIKRGKKCFYHAKDKPIGVIDEDCAHDNFGNIAWNKLYYKGLFNNIRYPQSRVFEDIATTHKLIHKAKKIVCLEEYLYNYMYRKDSIAHTSSTQNLRDAFASSRERVLNLIAYGYPPDRISDALYVPALDVISRTSQKDDLYMQAEEIVSSIRGIPKRLSIKHKVLLIIWRIKRRLTRLMCISKKNIKRINGENLE